ncbi:MAG: glycosyltransferase family 39 protein [Gaiellaceae bacterium MAG52_C11]|nr:glycosyltransferase family 39 protein [Candidatus Gaiellasilicea maunaloa]
MSRGRAYALVAAVCALPRLAVVAIERGDILLAYTEKSDDFARTLVASGTVGFIPGVPSAYTQPLYTFFLAPLYWVFGRHWLVVGLAQTLVAVATALLVYEIGRRIASARVGIVAAVLATLHPYLVWHDVHVNREILDTLLAAAIVLVTLAVAERLVLEQHKRLPTNRTERADEELVLEQHKPSSTHGAVGVDENLVFQKHKVPPSGVWLWGAALGALLGLAILGNSRLVLLPLVVLGYLVWRLRSARTILALGAAGAAAVILVLAPWVVRNGASVGCYAITTDTRALWKANNPATYDLLADGKWIDDVPNIPGAQLSPEFQAAIFADRGELIEVDECAQMRFYRGLVTDFWREQPGEKGKLAVQAAGMLWSPTFTVEREERSQGLVGVAKDWGEPLYMVALYLLAAVGIFLVSRSFAVLVVALLAYNTLAAMVFVGNVRYRVPWDLLLALLAAVALELARRVRAR